MRGALAREARRALLGGALLAALVAPLAGASRGAWAVAALAVAVAPVEATVGSLEAWLDERGVSHPIPAEAPKERA